MIKNASKEDAEAKFKAISDSIPTDFLRRRYSLKVNVCTVCMTSIHEILLPYIHRLISMSSNPETFLTLRTEFAKTLAISSLFGYILGLGYVHVYVYEESMRVFKYTYIHSFAYWLVCISTYVCMCIKYE